MIRVRVGQGCTTHLKARATNKSGNKVKGHMMGLGARGCAPSGVRGHGQELRGEAFPKLTIP